MLRYFKELEGFKVHAKDGEIGRVLDFYFDDGHWIVRYLMVGVGDWDEKEQALLSVQAIEAIESEPEHTGGEFHFSFTRELIKNSPPIVEPPSREEQAELHSYYKWPFYWDLSAGKGKGPGSLVGVPLVEVQGEPEQAPDPRYYPKEEKLRSLKQLTGFKVIAQDGEAGMVKDIILDDASWNCIALTIAMREEDIKANFIVPGWIKSIDWEEGKVVTDQRRESILSTPELDISKMIQPDTAGTLYDHYQKSKFTQ